MDEAGAGIFRQVGGAHAPAASRSPFDGQLRHSIDRYDLWHLFTDDGPGRHHETIRPSGYDYGLDAVDSAGMERWRADYRALTPARQMLAATIIWLYRGKKDSIWLRRVPCTWQAAEAVEEMRTDRVVADWGLLVSLYPGW
ncbi:MAG: hypothetical protein ABWX70_10555 [Hyphomicrobium sp.]